MTRTAGFRSTGTRIDQTVDFLAPVANTGGRAFGAWSVGPRQYSAPDVTVQGVRPVYNVILYGGRQTYSSRVNGAAPKVIIR
jgi:hypothetical protein